jgi:hypothetical protein
VVLALDGAALLGLGLWSRRTPLVLGGVFFLISAILARLSWRWYRRWLDEISTARRALRDDATDIRRVLPGE